MRKFDSITILDTELYIPVKQLTVDGTPIDVKWSPEAMQDMFAQLGDERARETIAEIAVAMKEEIARQYPDLTPEELTQLDEVLA